MDWRAADKLITALIVLLVAALLYDAFHLLRASQVNRALVTIDSAGDVNDVRTLGSDDSHLRFARAYALQQDGKFEPALQAYASIDVPEDDPMRAHTRYNLANLYLRRALQYRDSGADDLALPLVELAKEYYRELLRGDSQDWPAKYNLELALRVAPETDLDEVQEERNPEHNPRSAAGIQVRKPLP
jgi:mxaK protein